MGIHIGKAIKEELYRQEMSISAFAKKINRTRNVVYDIFERESIDTSLLNKIGLVLKVDFFSIYTGQKEYKKEGIKPASLKDEKANYNPVNEQLKLLEKEREVLLNEIAYLKKIISLMENKKRKPVSGK